MISILQINVAYPTSNYIFYRNYDNCYLLRKINITHDSMRTLLYSPCVVTIQTEKTNLLAVATHAFTLR